MFLFMQSREPALGFCRFHEVTTSIGKFQMTKLYFGIEFCEMPFETIVMLVLVGVRLDKE